MNSEKEKLHFEEAVIDHFVSDFNQRVEQPIGRGVFLFMIMAALLIFSISIGRIIFLTETKGFFYKERALTNINKTLISPAPRGLIVDRFQKPLLKNIPSFNVALIINAFLKEATSANLKENIKIIQEVEKISRILKLPADEIINQISNVDWELTNRIVIAHNIDLEEAIQLKTLNINGLEIGDDYQREYISGQAFAHIIGYTGAGNQINEVAGVSGLESYYDVELRGQQGEYIVLHDVKGTDIDKKILKSAEAGHQLITTIDSEFQTYFYNRLQQGLTELERVSGVGLAINPQTGEVLALINIPSFDNNNPAKFLKTASRPLFNRAISGIYSPGSTIKPLVALAALKEGIVTPDWETYSKGYLELPNPYNPDLPSRFLDWRAHGWVNLRSALARSSNIYFYILGGGCPGRLDCQSRPVDIRGLGIEKLKEYWRKFEFNQPTGIDLNGEAVGFLPDPIEKYERTKQNWRIGDTFNVSIGQGDLGITPIRLITMLSSIANGGKSYRPYLVSKIINEKNELVKENIPEESFNYSDWSAELREIQQGMRDAVAQPYGTANKLYDLPYRTAAKTGSAQISNNTKTNAFFVGYGPFDKPQVAILVLVEDAKEGSVNTIPIAYDVLKWYYEHRL